MQITFDVAKVDGTPGKVTWKCDQVRIGICYSTLVMCAYSSKIAVKEIFNSSSTEPYIVCNVCMPLCFAP